MIRTFIVKRVMDGYNQRHNLPPTVHDPKRLTRLHGSIPAVVLQSHCKASSGETLAMIAERGGGGTLYIPHENVMP
jgi:hypothetical protein